jgi:hypothetical protein
MIAHSPGPWSHERVGGAYGCIILDAEENGIAECDPRDGPLIAAALELLASLREMVAFHDCEPDSADPELAKARALLARLDGAAQEDVR